MVMDLKQGTSNAQYIAAIGLVEFARERNKMALDFGFPCSGLISKFWDSCGMLINIKLHMFNMYVYRYIRHDRYHHGLTVFVLCGFSQSGARGWVVRLSVFYGTRLSGLCKLLKNSTRSGKWWRMALLTILMDFEMRFTMLTNSVWWGQLQESGAF